MSDWVAMVVWVMPTRWEMPVTRELVGVGGSEMGGRSPIAAAGRTGRDGTRSGKNVRDNFDRHPVHAVLV
jgi:hypothetical protein